LAIRLCPASGIVTPAAAGASSPAAAERSNPYRLTISTTGGARPTIRGTANLPDHTKLMIIINKPWLPDGQRRLAAGLPACEDRCGYAVSEPDAAGSVNLTMVTNGRFTIGPFSFGDAPFRPGIYPVEIFVVPSGAEATLAQQLALPRQVYVSKIQVQE
jgi:hypothetical protein